MPGLNDRQGPPHGYTVSDEGEAGWVARNPAGDAIAVGWKSPEAAIRQAWEAADAVARAERGRQPGWFALAGDRILGGPFDARDEADACLARYVDDGTLRVAYGRRTEEWTFVSAPAPAEGGDHVSGPECRTNHHEESSSGA
ncbi:hypothetical protein CcI49_23245 [Frankia sp. CcI49]|uniref:hypothetical protein n=1 Tax=Frankia sp. CcI49 TaxID=1745382 RepID=UPI00097720F9|nr:hypothetical protein [Frankia sp. CcI49]ONH58374.1 hypothetical protein CcI49_23245 [Frankia sp. CcI49]